MGIVIALIASGALVIIAYAIGVERRNERKARRRGIEARRERAQARATKVEAHRRAAEAGRRVAGARRLRLVAEPQRMTSSAHGSSTQDLRARADEIDPDV
jgi:hypothetical protein